MRSKRNDDLFPIRQSTKLFYDLRVLCLSGLFCAMSIVLGKFLQIPNPFNDVIRISFENLPVIFAGVTLGPFVGGAVGVLADLIGCVLYGYPINPVVTLGALYVGVVSGTVAYLLKGKDLRLKVGAAVFCAHALGSVVIKSFGLAAWYLGQYDMGLGELMAWRALTYLIIGTAEAVIIYLLLNHKGLSGQLKRMLKK